MKLIHLSDLHIGKRVNGFPMIDDQRYILDQILGIIGDEKPQAVLIAGDIYDRPVPSAEAVQVFDDFISSLAETDADIFIISGNHDSAERLAFGSRIMDKRGIHIAGGYDGSTRMLTLEDEYGPVNIYMLPFIKPIHVRAVIAALSETEAESAAETELEYEAETESGAEHESQYKDENGHGNENEILSFTDALRFAIEKMDVDRSQRNVLIAHQFVTGALRSESEEISIGGLDNVDASLFDAFDYTALGHIHGPQDIVKNRIRYCGTPLKYSFSEADHIKSVTVVDMGIKGEVSISLRKLTPFRDMKVLKGSYNELTDKNYYKSISTDDYMRIILTDEQDVIGALGGLRAVYPNIMRLEYDNTRTRSAAFAPDPEAGGGESPLDVFASLYDFQNGKSMDEDQISFVSDIIDQIWQQQ